MDERIICACCAFGREVLYAVDYSVDEGGDGWEVYCDECGDPIDGEGYAIEAEEG